MNYFFSLLINIKHIMLIIYIITQLFCSKQLYLIKFFRSLICLRKLLNITLLLQTLNNFFNINTFCFKLDRAIRRSIVSLSSYIIFLYLSFQTSYDLIHFKLNLSFSVIFYHVCTWFYLKIVLIFIH